jgi:hypothetical protein
MLGTSSTRSSNIIAGSELGPFVFVDNGSTDDSVARAMRWPDTIVASTHANFRDYEALMREVRLHPLPRGRLAACARRR